jgi:hypothetical protein
MSEREFAIGQQVRIIRKETWQGRICTVLQRSEEEPDMYYLHPHGWRRYDEIEAVTQTSIGDEMELENKYLVLKRADIEAALSKQEQEDLLWLVNNVNIYRLKQGKPVNNYVVINQDEAYFPDVLRLMEAPGDARAESQAH